MDETWALSKKLKSKNDILSLAVFILICLAAGVIASMFTSTSVDSWFVALEKPVWNPPNWLFGLVWTVIYVLMAISGWLIWDIRDQPKTKRLLVIFGIQLFMNMAWSAIFFGLQQPAWAFLEIIILWILIGEYIILSWPISKLASVLFIPYWLWMGYATALNFAIWEYNTVG